MAFFAAWLTLAIVAATGQEWLKPIVWPTAALFLSVFLGHWARDYLRDVRRSQDPANTAFVLALFIALVLGGKIGYAVLHHVSPELSSRLASRIAGPSPPKPKRKLIPGPRATLSRAATPVTKVSHSTIRKSDTNTPAASGAETTQRNRKTFGNHITRPADGGFFYTIRKVDVSPIPRNAAADYTANASADASSRIIC